MSASVPRLAYSARAWVGRPLGPVVIPAALVIVGLVAFLAPEWLRNPDLSHGLFAPAVFGVLLWEGARQGGRVINYQDPHSIPALVSSALRHGFRREGAQYFVRLSSNRPWAEIRDEPLVRELAGNLSRIGLQP